MKLVVGLGNPGEKYVSTRHNLGFRVIEELGKKMDGGKWKMGVEDGKWRIEKKFKAEIIKLGNLILVKPLTYMNNSGQAVKDLMDYFKILISDVVIVHDELDLPLGKIKIRVGGSSGGHHGVESIIKALGDDKFIRVRLGTSTLVKHHDIEKFVTTPFLSSEKSTAKHMVKQAVSAVELLLEEGLKSAQNQYN